MSAVVTRSPAERSWLENRKEQSAKREAKRARLTAPARGPSPFPLSDFPFSPSERQLAQLWRDQTFPPGALVTGEGERLRVIYRGRPGAGPGPDFRDCLIAAAAGVLQGDVELHVRSSDFRRHGHHLDPAYANVVLHLAFEDDEGGRTLLPGGASAPVVALGRWARGRAEEIARWLARPALWREPCFSVERMGAGEVGLTLDRLGDMRFRQKAASFAARLRDVDCEDVLWAALLEALAYGGARDAFRILAAALPWQRLRASLVPLAPKDRTDEAFRLLAERLPGLPPPTSGLRPGNSPQRRLQGAARLAARFSGGGFEEPLVSALDDGPPGAAGRLTAALTVESYVGRGRAVELAANAALPWLAALGPESRTRRAGAAFAALPLSARYGAVRHLHQATAGAVRTDFRRQQGMLYLLGQHCTQGGCGRCPLS